MMPRPQRRDPPQEVNRRGRSRGPRTRSGTNPPTPASNRRRSRSPPHEADRQDRRSRGRTHTRGGTNPRAPRSPQQPSDNRVPATDDARQEQGPTPPPQNSFLWEEARRTDLRESDTSANLQGLITGLYEEIHSLKQMVNRKGDKIDPLILVVPLETREKILSGRFVDLSELLKKSAMVAEESKQLIGSVNEQGQLAFKPAKPTKAALTIDEWTSAFNVYISVTLLRHPEQAQGMLAYAEMIREAAREHPTSGAWRSYDELFRTKKAADPTREWDTIDNQLWLSLFCKPAKVPLQQVKTAPQARESRLCIFFNKVSGCKRAQCKWRHACANCNSPTHGSQNCRVGKRNPMTQEGDGSTSRSENQKERFRPSKQ